MELCAYIAKNLCWIGLEIADLSGEFLEWGRSEGEWKLILSFYIMHQSFGTVIGFMSVQLYLLMWINFTLVTEQWVLCCRAGHYLLGPGAMSPNWYDRHILTVGFACSFPRRENGPAIYVGVWIYKKNYTAQMEIKLVTFYGDNFSTVHSSLYAC